MWLPRNLANTYNQIRRITRDFYHYTLLKSTLFITWSDPVQGSNGPVRRGKALIF